MATNGSFTIGSTFDPFTFDELSKPYQMYQQAYEADTAASVELAANADKFKYLAETEPDSKARSIYENYYNDLKAQSDSVARRGLTMSNRKALVNLKKRYEGEIGRLEKADTEKKKLSDLQMNARLNDSSMLFNFDASTKSLDYYLDNPDASIRNFSGNTITAMVESAAAKIADELSAKSPEEIRNLAGNSYYELVQQYGMTKEAVLAAIQNPEKSPLLSNIVNDVLKSTGIEDWEGVKDATGNFTAEGRRLMSQAKDYANRGLWKAVGTAKTQVMENWKAKSALSLQNEKDFYDYKLAHPTGQKAKTVTGKLTDGTQCVITIDETGTPSQITAITNRGAVNLPLNAVGEVTLDTDQDPLSTLLGQSSSTVKASNFTPIDIQAGKSIRKMNKPHRGGGFERPFLGSGKATKIWADGITEGKTYTNLDNREFEGVTLPTSTQEKIKEEFIDSYNKLHDFSKNDAGYITMKDIVILIDSDFWNDNHYRIVLKNQDINGVRQDVADYWGLVHSHTEDTAPAQSAKQEDIPWTSAKPDTTKVAAAADTTKAAVQKDKPKSSTTVDDKTGL